MINAVRSLAFATLCAFALAGVIVAAAEPLDAEYVKLLQDLVKTPSVNGAQYEDAVAEIVAGFARDRGCEAEITSLIPAFPIVTVTVGPKDVPGLLIVAHTDTVSAEPVEQWTKPPFGAVVEDGRLYGRGAIDCKGGLVAGLAAVLGAREERNLRRPITLVCVPDEESGATGELGIKVLAAKGKLRGLGAIYAYPNMDKLILGHRGVYRVTIEITAAKGQHTGSRAWQDTDRTGNALAAAADLVREIEDLARSHRATNGEGLFEPYQTVITPVTMSSGVSPGLVPTAARLTLDARLLPGVGLELIRRQIWDRVNVVTGRRPALEYVRKSESYIPATEIDPEEKIVGAVRRAARHELGDEPKLAVSGPANESYLLNGYGIPTVILGPTGANAHGPDEYVELDSIATAARIYRRTHRLLSRMK